MIAGERDSVPQSVHELLRSALQEARRDRAFVARARFSEAVTRDPTGFALRIWVRHLVRHGHWSEAQPLATQLVQQALRRGDERLANFAASSLAIVSRGLGQWDAAARWQQKALRKPFDCQDLWSEISNRGNDALAAGRLRLAWRLFRSALGWERAYGTPEGAADNWGSLGNVAILRGRWRLAERCYRRAVRGHRQARNAAGIACDLVNLSRVSAASGDWTRTRCRLELAAKYALRARHQALIAEIARTRRELGRLARVASTNAGLN